jgi:hypothetical protein
MGRGSYPTYADIDARIAGSPSPGDRNQVLAAGGSGPGAGDDELSTLGVELGSVGLVECEKLDTEEIGSWLQAGGDGRGPLERVLNDSKTPFPIVHGATDESDLLDFELRTGY